MLPLVGVLASGCMTVRGVSEEDFAHLPKTPRPLSAELHIGFEGRNQALIQLEFIDLQSVSRARAKKVLGRVFQRIHGPDRRQQPHVVIRAVYDFESRRAPDGTVIAPTRVAFDVGLGNGRRLEGHDLTKEFSSIRIRTKEDLQNYFERTYFELARRLTESERVAKTLDGAKPESLSRPASRDEVDSKYSDLLKSIVSIRARPPYAGNRQFGKFIQVKMTNHGSGFFVASDLVLTNYHVVKDRADITVRLPQGGTKKAKLSVGDEWMDLALLRVDAIDVPWIPIDFAFDDAGTGDEAMALGAPLDEELAGTLTRGVVSARRTLDGKSALQFDAPVAPGSSGGPLIHADSRKLIGVVSMTRGGGFHFAYDLDHIREFFVRNEVMHRPSTKTATISRR